MFMVLDTNEYNGDVTVVWLDDNRTETFSAGHFRYHISPNFNEFVPEYNEETCEHGLSAWLCEGPNHYPMEY